MKNRRLRRIYAKIDLDALDHNLSQIKSALPCGVRVMSVIKADAYGHGAVEIAKHLENKCDYFGVAEVDEALELRQAGITTPILLLGYTSVMEFETVIKNEITVTVFRYSDAAALNDTAKLLNKTAKVHIAVDTGMSRIGFQVTEKDADEAAEIFGLGNVKVEGVFSHFATADEADKTYAKKQKELFDKFTCMLKRRGCEAEILHMNNSAGIIDMDESHYGMVRAGIMLYGLYPSDEVNKELFPLRPVMELITHISHVKTLPEGCGISYGRTFVTNKETRVATLPVGYADGYPRALSGKGYVLIHGKACPILGRVCMDQMMVDVSLVPDAEVGDEAVLFGVSDGNYISVEEISSLAYSFNYEFVCGVSRRVPRVYFRDDEMVKTVSYLEN